MAEHNVIGKIGEDYACEMLKKKGWTILERNWRMHHIEIDIIAANRKEIAFVEVKTRTSMYGGVRPVEKADARKRLFMQIAANAYVKYHRLDLLPRLDVIGLMVNEDTYRIEEEEWIENGFSPRLRTYHSQSISTHHRDMQSHSHAYRKSRY